jgi:ABC-type multidrug transport system permease subunit
MFRKRPGLLHNIRHLLRIHYSTDTQMVWPAAPGKRMGHLQTIAAVPAGCNISSHFTCSVFIKNRETGMVMFLFFSVILLFLSGVTWPLTNFPKFWKVFAYLFPSTFGIQGYLKLNTFGAEFGQILPEFIALWTQAIVYFITACFSFRYINK